MAVAGHQLKNLGGGGGGGSIGGITFVGNGINNYISASTTQFFFNNITGQGATIVFKQGDVFVISSAPANQTIVISGGSGATITAFSTSVIARPQATSGLASSFQATVLDHVLNRSGATLVWSQTRTNCYEDDSVTFPKMQEISAYTMMGNATNTKINPYEVPLVFPYDNQQQQFKNTFNGIDEINSVNLYSIISSITASSTSKNLLPEYTSYTTFIGTRTLPVNYLVKGKTIRFKAKGYTNTSAGDTLTLTLRLIDTGNTSTTIISSSNLSGNTGTKGFSTEIDFVCRDIGTSGLINVNGYLLNSVGYQDLINTSNLTLDTTKLYYLQLSGNTSLPSSTLAITHTTIEVLN